MFAQSPIETLNWIQTGGVVALLLMILWILLKRGLIPEKTHDEIVAACKEELERERARGDRWENLALKGTALAENSTDLAHNIAAAAHSIVEQQRRG